MNLAHVCRGQYFPPVVSEILCMKRQICTNSTFQLHYMCNTGYFLPGELPVEVYKYIAGNSFTETRTIDGQFYIRQTIVKHLLICSYHKTESPRFFFKFQTAFT